MFRTALLVLLAACSAPVAAETIVPVTIGDSEVKFAVDDGVLRVSETLPTNFAVMQAGLPPTNHLIEGFVSEADAKRLAIGGSFDGVLLQVQAMRNAEALKFTAEDWAGFLPVIRKGLGAIDLDALVKAQENAANQRMSDAAGGAVKREFGTIGKPAIYAHDAQSLRFVILIPGTYQVNGVSTSITLESAGAIVCLNGKVAYLYAYRYHHEGDDLTTVRTALDHFADRAIALNTDAKSAPATSSSAAASSQPASSAKQIN